MLKQPNALRRIALGEAATSASMRATASGYWTRLGATSQATGQGRQSWVRMSERCMGDI